MISMTLVIVVAGVASVVMLAVAYGLVIARARTNNTRLGWPNHAIAWVSAVALFFMLLGEGDPRLGIPGIVLFLLMIAYVVYDVERAIKKAKNEASTLE